MSHALIFGLTGGLLIGTAASLLMLLNGRILGASGILGDALYRVPDSAWRWSFLLGMLITGVLASLFYPGAFTIAVDRSLVACVVAGLLVGIGTQLSGGCTSGHGICGIGRLSMRSLIATLVFMFTGAATVYVVVHLVGGRI